MTETETFGNYSLPGRASLATAVRGAWIFGALAAIVVPARRKLTVDLPADVLHIQGVSQPILQRSTALILSNAPLEGESERTFFAFFTLRCRKHPLIEQQVYF